MHREALLQKILRDAGHKITEPRRLVFEALHGESPQSITELIRRLDGRVDRVTVYRTIELFERLNITKRIAIGWKYKLELGDIFSSHHHHITCLGCGRVVAIKEDASVERLIETLGAGSGFRIVTHQLELQGYCNRCT